MCNNVIFRLLFSCIIISVYLKKGTCLGDNAYDDVILPYWQGTTEVTEIIPNTTKVTTKKHTGHNHSIKVKTKKSVVKLRNVMPWMVRLYTVKGIPTTTGIRLPFMDFLVDSSRTNTSLKKQSYFILPKLRKSGRNQSESKGSARKSHHLSSFNRKHHHTTGPPLITMDKHSNHPLKSIDGRRKIPVNMYSVKWPESFRAEGEATPRSSGPQIDLGENECDGNDIVRPQAILKLMKCIASKDPEARISTEVVGRTSEYNDIVLLRISRESSLVLRSHDSNNIYVNEPPPKKTIFIVHGLNVQGMRDLECLSRPNNMTKLMGYYFKYLDKFDILFMPLANPDGFSFARTNPLWNKNLSPQNACPGVALDRNFDISWTKSQNSSCSQHYEGESPFSEPETRAIKKIFHDNHHKIVAFINVHASSFDNDIYKGDAVLYPKGYTEKTSDDDKYVDLKGEIDEMMKNASFQVISVTVDSLYNWYGPVTGSSVDYASSVYGVPYALEFAMQQYKEGPHFKPTRRKSYATLALEEIWTRIIDVVFLNIHKAITKDANKQQGK